MGILAWENELIQYPGNLIHPDTFSFPVQIDRVNGANYDTVVKSPSDHIAREFAISAQHLEANGVDLIISTTGLSILFQNIITDSVSIPVITSSLMFVPMLSSIIGRKKKIGIITAGEQLLSKDHLKVAGIDEKQVQIVGVDKYPVFESLAIKPEAVRSSKEVETISVELAKELMSKESNIGLIVIEVTGLCAGSGAIRKQIGLPVMDIVECAVFFHNAITADRWNERRSQSV